MKITLEKKILTGFIICSLILLVVAAISFKNSEKVIDSNQWVNHTHEVLFEFEQVMASSVDAETGTRGFVITGNENFLEPFRDAQLKLSEHLARARELTRDNPVQQKNIESLEKLIDTHKNF